MLSSVDLPLPEGPSRTTSSDSHEVEVDAGQGVHLHLAHAVHLGEPAGAEHHGRWRGRSHARAQLTPFPVSP